MTAAKAAAKKADKAEEKKVTQAAEPEVKKEVEKAAPKKKTTKAKAPKAKKGGAPVAHGVGRRKACVARVWLRKGTGVVTVNGRPCDEYFDTEITRLNAQIPMKVIPAAAAYDVDVNVVGGGLSGQADAVKLAVSRALVEAEESLRPILREFGLLTVDPRVVERKKPGQKKARRKFQFVKR